MTRQHTLAETIASILVVAAVATTGDYVWYTCGVEHRMVAGITHGIVLLTSCGLVLGGALSYYLLVAIMDRRVYGTAIPAAWVIMWLLLAAMDGRWLLSSARSWREVAARGVAAAVLGGLAFAVVLTTLWGPPGPSGRNYLVQFLAWAFAWAPGILAVTWTARGGVDDGPRGNLGPSNSERSR